MKTIKKHFPGILLCLFELITGLLVVLNSKTFNKVMIVIAGIGLILYGLVQVIRYYQAEPKVAAKNRYLMKGLLYLSCGFFCTFRSNWFVAVLPSFSFLLGVGIFIIGLVKIQQAMDMTRVDNKQWYLAFITAAVSLACAAAILSGPNKRILWVLIGIVLVLEAAADTVILVRSIVPKKPKAVEPVPEEVSAEETPVEENNA